MRRRRGSEGDDGRTLHFLREERDEVVYLGAVGGESFGQAVGQPDHAS